MKQFEPEHRKAIVYRYLDECCRGGNKIDL